MSEAEDGMEYNPCNRDQEKTDEDKFSEEEDRHDDCCHLLSCQQSKNGNLSPPENQLGLSAETLI